MNEWEAYQMIEATHDAIHDLEQDLEDVATFAMTKRDAAVIGLSLAILGFSYPCLNEVNRDLQVRITEVARFQQPTWFRDDDGEG